MNCLKVRTILDQAVEEHDRLAPEVTAHLESCPACAAYYAEQVRMWSMLDLLPTVEPTAGFRAAFWQRVQEAESPAWWKGGWTSWFPAAQWSRTAAGWALVLLLTLGSVLILNHRIGPTLGDPVQITAGLEDEQLLEGLGIIVGATSSSALENYDLWGVDADASLDFPTPLLIPQNPLNSDLPNRGANHEKIG